MALVDIEKEDVLAFAAELSTVVDDAWDRILPFVNELDMTGLGESEYSTTLARIYLAAHLGAIAKPSTGSSAAAAGPVTSESVGGIRRTYANLTASSSGDALLTTKFGRQYSAHLKMTLSNGPFLV